MSTDFFRFPHTAHILWLGYGMPRDDKLLTPVEVNELLSADVIIEEKIDGANIGFSLDIKGEIKVQNRGSYLTPPYNGQFSRLNGWLGQYGHGIKENLSPSMIAFGEWCAARHSLDYTSLPDYFLLFDVYNSREQKFWSVSRRNEWAKKTGLRTVPQIEKGRFEVDQLQALLKQSTSYYRKGSPEGIVIRQDDSQWNNARGKLVQAEFVQAISDHWSSRAIEWNNLASEKGDSYHV